MRRIELFGLSEVNLCRTRGCILPVVFVVLMSSKKQPQHKFCARHAGKQLCLCDHTLKICCLSFENFFFKSTFFAFVVVSLWAECYSPKGSLLKERITCKSQLDLVIFLKWLLCLNLTLQRSGARHWWRGNDAMFPSLWSFPAGYCVFLEIIVVRTVRSSREGEIAIEGKGSGEWWANCSPRSPVFQWEECDSVIDILLCIDSNDATINCVVPCKSFKSNISLCQQPQKLASSNPFIPAQVSSTECNKRRGEGSCLEHYVSLKPHSVMLWVITRRING